MPTQEYDVVVVGAGILGCSSAYHIQRLTPSAKTLLIDRLPAAGQANTGRSAAMFRNAFTSKDNRTLADTSINYYLHVERELGVDLGVELVGYLWLLSENQLRSNKRQIDIMKDEGVELSDYSSSELKDLIPGLTSKFEPTDDEHKIMGLEAVAGGVLAKKCGALKPEKLVDHYVREFVRLGGKVAYNTAVTELIIEPRKKLGLEQEPLVWQDSRIVGVRTRGEIEAEIRAKRSVLATGAWANELLEPRGIDSHTKAKKRQLFRVETAAHHGLVELLGTRGFNAEGIMPFMILPKSSIYIKPVKSEGAFWIGCDDEVNRPYINTPSQNLGDFSAEPSHYENNIYPVLKEYFPAFAGVRPTSMWAGLFGINSIDHLPYVFAEQGAVVVAGDSGSGIMKGDALGRIVAETCDERGDGEAELFGGVRYRVDKLHYKRRDVEQEEWIL